MLQNMLIAAEQVAILYIIALVGVICDKLGWFTEPTAKKCTDLLFYVVTSAKILESFYTLEYSTEHLKGLFIAIGAGLIFHFVAALITAPFFNKQESDKAVVYKYACIYGNCGYMGLPLVDAVVGDEGVFYCSAFVIAFQIVTFTHGVWLVNKGKSENKAKFNPKSLILNPGVIPVIIGLPLFLFKVNLPKIVSSPISSLASMLSPLAMLIFGAYLSHTDFRSIRKNLGIFLVALIKLIVLPIIMLVSLKIIGLSGALAITLVIAAATPPANNTTMFAAKYDRDASLGSQIVAIVSLISIITLPVIIALADYYV